MKRYFCTVAAGIVLALTGTATASANDGLPLPGQSGTQVSDLGDQSVGEQKNDADVTQAQGNGNVNISPAIAVFGDAETTNSQGNDNVAKSDVDQENDVDQTQSSEQHQSGTSSTCCGGQSQAGEQKTYGGDQSVDRQENDADVSQWQGNGNVNVAPAVAVFGDAETTNEQGNDNVAKSDVDQKNTVDQTQSSTQKQELDQGPGCCPSKGYDKHGKSSCCDGQSQAGEQKASFGDQSVDKQRNDADVTQKQGNGNVNVSPAIAVFGDAKTSNEQGNGNYASSDVDQRNDVDQTQRSYQRQSLDQNGACCGGRSQAGEQRFYGGDQHAGKQRNDADVSQWQGNGNVNVSPAIAIFGDAETRNRQGNDNVAKSYVDQRNDVDQSQSSKQKQYGTADGGGCCQKPQYDCKHGCEPKKGYGHDRGCEPKQRYDCTQKGHERGQQAEQKASSGDQHVGKQRNDADVTQKQGNGNLNLSPALGFGGKHDSCSSKCGKSRYDHHAAATTTNEQGNGNYAKSDLDQKNTVDQSQTSYQSQSLVTTCKRLIR